MKRRMDSSQVSGNRHAPKSPGTMRVPIGYFSTRSRRELEVKLCGLEFRAWASNRISLYTSHDQARDKGAFSPLKVSIYGRDRFQTSIV